MIRKFILLLPIFYIIYLLIPYSWKLVYYINKVIDYIYCSPTVMYVYNISTKIIIGLLIFVIIIIILLALLVILILFERSKYHIMIYSYFKYGITKSIFEKLILKFNNFVNIKYAIFLPGYFLFNIKEKLPIIFIYTDDGELLTTPHNEIDPNIYNIMFEEVSNNDYKSLLKKPFELYDVNWDEENRLMFKILIYFLITLVLILNFSIKILCIILFLLFYITTKIIIGIDILEKFIKKISKKCLT